MEPEPFKLPPGMAASDAVEVLAEAFFRHFEKLQGRIRQLEGRLGELEARGVEFRGEYQRALDYKRGSLVLHGDALFAAVRAAEAGDAPPGPSWQICISGGRNGLRVAS